MTFKGYSSTWKAWNVSRTRVSEDTVNPCIAEFIVYIGVGHEGGGAAQGGMPSPPKKIGKNIFRANYYVKFRHFSGKNHVKFGNFVNFSGKYHRNSGISIIFRATIM